MKNKKITIHFTLGNYTLISYEKQYIGTEYVVAMNYNADKISWVSGTYFTDIEPAVATMLRKVNSAYVKDRYQMEIEKENDICYARVLELASLFKDGLIEDDAYEASIYFDETCEMTESEKKFFGIEETETEEW